MGALYARTDPLLFALAVCAVLAAACWLVSVLTDNYSQVDRLWSLAPPLYACHFAARAGWVDQRLNVIALLVVLWGGRLTYNFARKGGYRWHAEDYRWPELRQRLGPVWFQLLNATFVAPYQNLLLLLIVLPASVAWQARGTPLNALDAAAAVAFVLLLIGETVADQAAVALPVCQTSAQGRGRTDRSRVCNRWPLPILASPELLLRASHVVDDLRLLDRRVRRVAQLVDRGCAPADTPVPGVHAVHGGTDAAQVPCLSRLPANHLPVDPVVSQRSAQGAFGP